jgi:hypothetical protein
MSDDTELITPAEETKEESNTMRIIGWVSAGLAAVALGILVGRELRSRYKFNRRTPYDYYANAGEYEMGEYGVGI